MEHIDKLNFEGGFQKVNSSGLITDDKRTKLCKCIPFRTAFIILTGLSIVSLLTMVVDMLVNDSIGNIGILELIPIGIQLPAAVLFALNIKEETRQTRKSLITACYLNALAFLVAFIIHIWKFISDVN